MFICEECGEVFKECKSVEEHHPYGMTYATEYFSVCPRCESTEIKKAKQCDGCGEWFAELEDDLCESCWDDMYGE